MSSSDASPLESAKWGDSSPGSLPTRIAKRQRRRMFCRFLQSLSPAPDADILDVGGDEANLNLMSRTTLADAAQSAGITNFRIESVMLLGWTSNLLLIASKEA
jgi:hypothetical protein